MSILYSSPETCSTLEASPNNGFLSTSQFRFAWPAEAPSPIQEEDKASVRDNLLESIIRWDPAVNACSFPEPAALVPAHWAGCGLQACLSLCRAPPIVRVQLGECLKLIAYTDHPELWPGLLPLVVQNLNTQASVVLQTLCKHLGGAWLGSATGGVQPKMGARSHLRELVAVQDHSRIYGCLFALRILARKYEFRDSGERVPLEQVVEATFPAVLQLVQVPLLQRLPCTHTHICYHCMAKQSAELGRMSLCAAIG